MKKDIVIIGGGAAGLAAALKVKSASVILIERSTSLGGILNQCIHNGFGLHVFKEELTGPEYANKYIEMFEKEKIEFMLDTSVIDIKKDDDFVITISNYKGIEEMHATSVILATGCYERTRGFIQIPGDRPPGVIPAGSAQRYLNIDGYLVGKKVFILGSGDIGLIMARRMKLEGADVLGVAELMPYSNGLTRNIVQCLDDFNIPLYLSHTVTQTGGKDHLEYILIQEVDENRNLIEGTEKKFEVDTLLLSVGLVPDIALLSHLPVEVSPITKSVVVNQYNETNVQGLFACGNSLHVHDLVDNVTKEAEKTGENALKYVQNDALKKHNDVEVLIGDNIRYTVPQKINFENLESSIELLFRTTNKCNKGTFKVTQSGQIIKEKKAKFIAPAEMEKIVISQMILLVKNQSLYYWR